VKRKYNGKINKKLPLIRKDIKDFLLSEEGKISKKNIAKIGVSLAILGMMLQPQDAQAGHNNHDRSFAGFTVHANCHSNHDNHSHGGGWC
jgi:hypothetical protein